MSTMDINASIVDQRIIGIIEQYPELLPDADRNKKKATAFVLLCMSTALELSIEEAAELLTDGGNDAGIDGLYIGEADDGEFTVTIFQGKYKMDLSGNANFPERDVQRVVDTITAFFDPSRTLLVNEKILPKLEDIRSLVRDGYIPTVRVILCNNGAKWTQAAQSFIDAARFGGQVAWIHFNHNNIVEVLQRKKAVDDKISLKGKAIVEDFNFRRMLLGKISVKEIAELFDRHDDLLLERNIRRYLGLHENRVNDAIHRTLKDESKRDNFYFFNNGVTMICRKFRYNALQQENYQIQVEGMQIINGGQTCKTIQQTLKNIGYENWPANVYVLLRLYELADNDQDFIQEITYATNSQNPVDLRDLHSNDEWQKRLETDMKGLGYLYKRQRGGEDGNAAVITSATVAEAVLAIWRSKPNQAKFWRKEHFGKLYHTIFEHLNAAQAILAVLIFRFVENERKRPRISQPPDFIPYASHYLAMLLGRELLEKYRIELSGLSHQNFSELANFLEKNKENFYQHAISQIQSALKKNYGDRKISLQQLSATFRRGDLLEYLDEMGTFKS
jgi:AIPR protein